MSESDWETITTARRAKLEELLLVAACPDVSCDGEGTISIQCGIDEWETHQCEWCYEREQVLNESNSDKSRAKGNNGS